MKNSEAVVETLFDKRKAQSCHDFITIIKPYLIPMLGGGGIVSVENAISEMAQTLDMEAGIDYVYRDQEGRHMPLCSRINYKRYFATFTINVKTKGGGKSQYDRIVNVRATECLYPKIMVQSYIDHSKNIINGIGVAYTDNVLAMIDLGNCHLQRMADGSEFYAVKWQDMIKFDMPVRRMENISIAPPFLNIRRCLIGLNLRHEVTTSLIGADHSGQSRAVSNLKPSGRSADNSSSHNGLGNHSSNSGPRRQSLHEWMSIRA